MSHDPLEKKHLPNAVIPIRSAWQSSPARDDRWLIQNLRPAQTVLEPPMGFAQQDTHAREMPAPTHDPAKTVLLVHGLWLAPQSWEFFSSYYEARGYRVLAPAWPRMAERVDEIRRDPSVLSGLGLKEITDHYARLIRSLPAPPILMGHCIGGLVVQMLLDRGLGSAGVAIDSAVPKGIAGLPLGILSSVWPAISGSFHTDHTVMLPFNVFRRVFANTMSDGDAIRVYRRNIVPGPCRPLYQSLFSALTSHSEATVNFCNPERAPLLLIAGGEDQFVPPDLLELTYQRYQKSPATTAFQVFSGRSHLIQLQTGWQVVAGYALSWAEENARRDGWAARACGGGIA